MARRILSQLARSRHPAIVGVIVFCSVVFLYQEFGPEDFTYDYAAVPTIVHRAAGEFIADQGIAKALGQLARLVTAVFLHGDGNHILYNMVFLWAFGILCSDTLGQWLTLVAFLFCGVVGNVAQVLLNLDSPFPILGASGGIMGLEGLYLGLALQWHLPDPAVWPLAYPIAPQRLAAFAVLGFAFDVYSLMNHQQGIAYGAHVGGFVAGVVVALLMTRWYPTMSAYHKAWRRR